MENEPTFLPIVIEEGCDLKKKKGKEAVRRYYFKRTRHLSCSLSLSFFFFLELRRLVGCAGNFLSLLQKKMRVWFFVMACLSVAICLQGSDENESGLQLAKQGQLSDALRFVIYIILVSNIQQSSVTVSS